jgi:hypothetical protein
MLLHVGLQVVSQPGNGRALVNQLVPAALLDAWRAKVAERVDEPQEHLGQEQDREGGDCQNREVGQDLGATHQHTPRMEDRESCSTRLEHKRRGIRA